MITKDFLQYTGFCAPVISSLSCAVMLAIYRHRHGRRDENILYRLLITYFLAISLLWAISLVYVYFPLLYVRINILYFIGLLWGQVVFYQFIYTLTRLPGEKPWGALPSGRLLCLSTCRCNWWFHGENRLRAMRLIPGCLLRGWRSVAYGISFTRHLPGGGCLLTAAP